MKDLLEFIISGIIESTNIEIEESSEDERTIFDIKAGPDDIGMIIGKNGKTIRAIRNLMKVRATLEKTPISVTVSEK